MYRDLYYNEKKQLALWMGISALFPQLTSENSLNSLRIKTKKDIV